MPYGTYTIQNASGYADFSSSRDPALGYRSMAQRITFDQPVIIRSVMPYYSGQTTTGNAPLHTFVIDRVSTGERIFSQNIWMTSTGGQQEHVISPVGLEAGVQYSIGYEVPAPYDTYIAYDTSGTAQDLAGVSSPAGITSTWYGYLYYSANAGSMPTTTLADNLYLRFSVDLNTLPNAPTNVAVTNSPVPTGTAPNVSWTHNDPDTFQPQSKYQFRWRKKDS